jgi:GTP-binding protein
LVAIVGRPNVGKSTLFNRIVGRRRALVDDQPGVTRDRLIERAQWAGREFRIVDTGGFEAQSEADLSARVREQSLRAVSDAAVVLFVVDGRAGLSPLDRALARHLAASGKPLVCVVNKIDGLGQDPLVYEFFSLGLGEPLGVSAEHAAGLDDMLDRMVAEMPKMSAPAAAPSVRIALVGRPNVGKSSILNRLVGEDRVLVDAEAGTTRDPIDILLEKDGLGYLLVDTAGMRRKSRIDERLEKATVSAALRSVERADVALLVIDAGEGITEQDARIARLVWERGRGLLLVANKWDTLPPEKRDPGKYLEEVRRLYAHFEHVPMVAVSATAGTRIEDILPAARKVGEAHRQRLPTRALNDLLAQATTAVEPPILKGKRARLYYATAVGHSPPAVALFVNQPEHVSKTYLRYLENRLREAFSLEGTPLRLALRARPRRVSPPPGATKAEPAPRRRTPGARKPIARA